MESIDFHQVAERHEAIHLRLENWGRWCHNRGGTSAQPMFRWVKPSQQWEAAEVTVPVDVRDALVIEKRMHELPARNYGALAWCYVYRTSPRSGWRSIGAGSEQGLWDALVAGRTMIQNLTR